VATAEDLTWSLDGKDFFYVDVRADVANVWTVPVTGSTPKQLTKFTSEFIDNYSISPDGKRFIIARSWGNNDIILIKNFRD
jgi:Tol biopolymer transport system component